MKHMNRIKLKIEYPLRNTAINVLWNSISQPIDLCEWFAESITQSDDIYTFMWQGHEQDARMLETKYGDYIRFQWLEDAGTNYYFEFKIVLLELTGDVALVITDYVDSAEKDDSILLWNQQVEQLKLRLGI